MPGLLVAFIQTLNECADRRTIRALQVRFDRRAGNRARGRAPELILIHSPGTEVKRVRGVCFIDSGDVATAYRGAILRSEHQHACPMTVSETPHLRLRHVRSADAPFVLELLTDPDFLANVGDRDVHNLQDAHRYIMAGPAASYRRHGFGLWLVELKSAALASCTSQVSFSEPIGSGCAFS